MRKAGLLFWLAAGLAVPAAMAGDASGFDPAAISQCLADASSQGAQADCTEAGMAACLDHARDRYTGDDPDFPQWNCLDAAHQAWEAELTATYRRLLEQEGQAGIKPQEMLRQAEHSWIAFRDELCNWTGEAAQARGESRDLAALRCRRDEAARHHALLASRLNDGGG